MLAGARLAQQRLDVIPSLGLAAQYDLTRVNFVPASEDFASTSWVKNIGGTGLNPAVTPNAELAPDGTMTAARLVLDLAGGTTSADVSQFSSMAFGTLAAGNYTSSIWLRTTDGTTKSVVVAGPTGNGASFTITPSWQQFSTTILNSAATTFSIKVRLRGSEGTSGQASLAIWHPQTNGGLTVLPYERTYDAQTVVDSGPSKLNGFLGASASVEATDPVVTPAGLVFDGTDDQVNLPTTIALNPDHTTIVVCTPTSGLATPDYRAVLGVGGTAGNLEYESVALSASTYRVGISFRRDGDGTQQLYDYGDNIPIGTASMIANVTSNTDPTYGYVNGVQKFQVTQARRPQVFAQIGHRAAGRNFPGVIHYVAVYNRALTPREIMTAYRALRKRLASRGVTLP